MKKIFHAFAVFCLLSTNFATTFLSAAEKEINDQYGMPIELIGLTRYNDVLKKRICEKREYSCVLLTLLTRHYELLLEGEECLDDYINFYQECYTKATDPLLKTAYHLRLIRGLFRKPNKSRAEDEMKIVDLKSIKLKKNEQGYYKILLTYLNFSKESDQKIFYDAISFYEKNNLNSFDLASLYLNCGVFFEESDPEKSYYFYQKGIKTTNSKILLQHLFLSIHRLTAKNSVTQQRFSYDLITYLNSMQNNEQKLNLLTRILETNFFEEDIRNNRKIMEMCYLLMNDTSNPVLLFDANKILITQELASGNYADASQQLDLFQKKFYNYKWKYNKILLKKLKICVNTCINKDANTEKEIMDLTTDILLCDISIDEKINLLKFLIIVSATKKYWRSYDFIVTKTKENKLYMYLGRQIVEDFLLKSVAISDFQKNDIIHIAKSIPSEVIAEIPIDIRGNISAYFSTVGEFELAKLWQPQKTTNDFFSKLVRIENIISLATTENYKIGLQMLNELKPEKFQIDGKSFTKNDAETLILYDKLGVFINMNAISNYTPVAKRLEEIYPKCSQNLKDKWGASIIGELGFMYLSLGVADKAIPSLTKALAVCSSRNVYYAVLKLNLGKAYLLQKNIIDAEESFETARKIFKEQNNAIYFVRASNHLAAIKILKGADFKISERILMESIDIAIKQNFHDELCRAYSFLILGIAKDKKTIREKKIMRIMDIEKKSVTSTDNPTILAGFFAIVAKIKDENNFPPETVIANIEKYFQYQKLFFDVLTSLPEDSDLVQRNKIMQDTLFRLLGEIGDTKKIDYWNKIFERDRTRSVELQSQQAKVDTKMLSVLALISKFENAQQILAHEQSKKESEQDKLLIQKALKLKREIEQQYELARKNLSAKDLKLFEALLSDNFIIHPDSLSQLSSILPTGTACLQFLNVGENIIAYIAVKDTPPFTISISLRDKGLTQKKFSQKLIKVRNLLQNKANVSTVNKELAELYSVLFSEIEKPLEKLNVKSIVVNASGILRYVPMATLFDGKKYLIEKYQVTNITGLDLIRLSKSNEARQISDVKAAIFADPDDTLRYGHIEGKTIAKFFANKKLYLGNEASLEEFESMVGNVNFVHLATHAVLDPNEPGKSYIQFADGKKWYYSDMMGFNIQNVDSIALSACETAVSEKSTGGEIEGMAYQLLKKSPSGSVLASFWKVDDTATAMLMGIYYKHVTDSIKTNHTLDRGGALREAQLNLLKNPDTCHPYYWAAFTLFGDFR